MTSRHRQQVTTSTERCGWRFWVLETRWESDAEDDGETEEARGINHGGRFGEILAHKAPQHRNWYHNDLFRFDQNMLFMHIRGMGSK